VLNRHHVKIQIYAFPDGPTSKDEPYFLEIAGDSGVMILFAERFATMRMLTRELGIFLQDEMDSEPAERTYPQERPSVQHVLESFACPRCGHPAYSHIDIASYRMSRDQDNWRWCSGADGCRCGLSFDDMMEIARSSAAT
jgi:hypothetical protein